MRRQMCTRVSANRTVACRLMWMRQTPPVLAISRTQRSCSGSSSTPSPSTRSPAAFVGLNPPCRRARADITTTGQTSPQLLQHNGQQCQVEGPLEHRLPTLLSRLAGCQQQHRSCFCVRRSGRLWVRRREVWKVVMLHQRYLQQWNRGSATTYQERHGDSEAHDMCSLRLHESRVGATCAVQLSTQVLTGAFKTSARASDRQQLSEGSQCTWPRICAATLLE